jgi:hypothetical protein
MTAKRPRPAAGPLDSLATVLGEKSPHWATLENRDSIIHQITGIPETAANALNLNILRPMASAYGEALKCKFSTAGEPGLDVTENITQDEIDAFRRDIAGVGEFRLDLRLEKKLLIESWFGKLPGDVDVYLYLYPEAAERDFLSPITTLERIFWPQNPSRKVVVILPDITLALNGDLLAVLGSEELENWNQYAHPPIEDVQSYQKINRDAQDSLRWQIPWVSHLTPAHLWVSGTSDGGDCLVHAIQSQFVNLFLLYTADRTLEQGGQFVSTYSGAKFSAEINWGPHGTPLLFNWADINTLEKTFLWAYNPTFKAGDRLPLVQINIAKTVRVMDQAQAYGQLVKSAKGLFVDLDEQWNEVIENRIDAFSDRKDKLAEQVLDSINKFTNQITEIIDSLSNAALALVAVLIGSFIAALFQDKFNKTVFTIGMLIYAGYVAIFPLLYNMINQWRRFRTQESIFRRNLETSAKQLEESTIGQIVGDEVSNTTARFKRWYVITIILYILLVLLILFAAFAGPRWVSLGAQLQTLTPTAIPISTIMPIPTP